MFSNNNGKLSFLIIKRLSQGFMFIELETPDWPVQAALPDPKDDPPLQAQLRGSGQYAGPGGTSGGHL